MAAVMVLISGWIGLAYAVIGYIMTGTTMLQFLATWSLAGLAILVVFGVIVVLRRFTATNAPLHA